MRVNYKYTSHAPNSIGVQIPNGRRQLDRTNEKNQEAIDTNLINIDKGNQAPIFAKPFKVPQLNDQQISKTRTMTTHMEPPTPSPDGGKDVESILKFMTSTLEPLTKIAATPRNEIEIQQPNKPYVYANLPPFFKPISNSSSKFNLDLFGEHSIFPILISSGSSAPPTFLAPIPDFTDDKTRFKPTEPISPHERMPLKSTYVKIDFKF